MAARYPLQPVSTVDEQGHAVEIRGRVDAVIVTRTSVQERFEAPVDARFDGPALTVWTRGTLQSYARQDVTRVKVQHYDTHAAVRTGTVLTVLGAAMTLGGTLLFAQVGHAKDGLPFIGLPIITAGIGLGAGGIPLIVAGNRPPAGMITAGPGGLQLRF